MNTHSQMMTRLLQIKSRLDQIEGEKRSIERQVEEQQDILASSELMGRECDEAGAILDIMGETSRRTVQEQIESLVSRALVTAFNREDYGFSANFVTRRNQIECDLLARVGDRLEEPLESGGGGRVDIITTALRFVLISLTRHPGPIALDEPGKWVSPEFRANFMAFIKEFANQTERQVIMSTQLTEYLDTQCNTIRIVMSADGSAREWVE